MKTNRHFRRATGHARTRGLSLIETLCAASIVATTLGVAAPSFTTWQHTQALQAAAAELETDIQYARTLAVSRNASVRLSAGPLESGGSCYVIHTGHAHACVCGAAGQVECDGDAEALRVVGHAAGGPVTMANEKLSIAFDGESGTVTPTATFKFADPQGRALHQVVNIMGRTRTCSPNGQIHGIKPC
jgi:type IV fimbrial biogenesis protein FimT